jgi:hypothetical protein
MNLKALTDIDKDDLLAKIGLETMRSTAARVAFGLELFGLGLLVGAGLAVFLTPKSGRELREKIGEKLRRVPEEAST